MALYLGTEKINLSSLVEKHINYKTGTVMSNDNGQIQFPALDFEPKLIAIWNVSTIDQWEDADPAECVRYLTTGIMLFAIKQNGIWISQGAQNNSGGVYITNASAELGQFDNLLPGHSFTNVFFDGESYVYSLYRSDYPIEDGEDSPYDLTNTEFHYAIYG